MDATLNETVTQYDQLTIRAITVAVVLSLFVHLAILLLPILQKSDRDLRAPAEEIGPLSVTIAAAKPPAPSTPQEEQKKEPQKTQPPPKASARPRSTPLIALNRPSTGFTMPAPPTPEAAPSPPSAAPPTEVDLSAYIEARRRARQSANSTTQEPAEDDDARAKRIAIANIKAQERSANPGTDPDEGGGIFQLQRTGLHEAEFLFRGWNKSFRRTWAQQVEVRQGSNADIRIAVIRRMIEIIREQKPGDFVWESHRLHRAVTMSARPEDTAQLETFLMKEFYPEDGRAR